MANPQHFRDRERPDPIELLLQVFPGDVLHDQVGDREVLHGVDVDHIFVADRGGGPRLAEELLAVPRARGQGLADHLDGDQPVQLPVERLHDGPEAPRAQDLKHFVMRQAAERAGLLGWRKKVEWGLLLFLAALVGDRRDRLGRSPGRRGDALPGARQRPHSALRIGRLRGGATDHELAGDVLFGGRQGNRDQAGGAEAMGGVVP